MPILYKGVGIGTYWHGRDPFRTGFLAAIPGQNQTTTQLMSHIVHGSILSPYISLTRSYGVAWDYATHGRAFPTSETPGYVYVIEINDPPPPGMVILDPVKEVAIAAPGPLADVPYQHDGLPEFLLSVIDNTILPKPCKTPHGNSMPRTPNLSLHIEALVRAIRDAEIFANIVPATCVVDRIDIY